MTIDGPSSSTETLTKIEEYLECVKSSRESLVAGAFIGMLLAEMLEITEVRCDWHNGENLASLEVCIGNSNFFKVYCDIDKRRDHYELSYVNEHSSKTKLTANNIHEFYEYVTKVIKRDETKIQTTESADDQSKVSAALELLEDIREMERDLLELGLEACAEKHLENVDGDWLEKW